MRVGHLDAAREYCEKAQAIHKKLVAQDPNNIQWHIHVAGRERDLGQVEFAARRYDAAAAQIGEALKELNDLVGRGLHVPETNLTTYRNSETLAQRAQQASESEAFVLAQPEADRPRLMAQRAWGLAVAGKTSEAAEAAEKLRGSSLPEAVKLYCVASAYALCVQTIAGDKPPLPAERLADLLKYQKLAMDALSLAGNAGFFAKLTDADRKWLEDTGKYLPAPLADLLKYDADLAALHELPEFKALVEKFSTRPKDE
jgi:hypothetical protein